MNRLFWRFALLVMLAITLATCAIYFTFSRLFGDPLEEIARRQAAGQIFLLEQYIDKAPSDEWLPRLNKVREVSEATLELQPLPTALAALPPSKREQLLQGAVIIDVGGKAFYRRVDTTGARYIGSDDDVIHAQRLPIDIGQALSMEAIRFGVIALFLLVPIGWWTRRHWRGLLALSKVADDFGQGNLAARAEVRPASSIAPLACRINDMAERIGLLMDAHKNLLRSVSHELRTPIARLEFGLELLRERHAADDPSLQKRIVAMETDVDELKTLVNELLGLTQLDQAQPMPRQLFSLAPLLQGCAPPQSPAQGQQFSASIAGGLGELQGDARLLARAVNNLLGNAAKYAVSRVVLSAERDGSAVHITVEDDGPGIPPEARERVFEPFYRLAREQDYAASGYGLGLAITAKAVQLHGGAIAIDDSPLGGARITITL
ncbi:MULTISPECIES: ATP-binding protein [unclassified Duganella]|uniref:ATP-binding protein n=1 Tax=unclassified Duganella TaxID=2636909 RepID=UPI000E3463DC|nr:MULTISPECIES: ATP-binding protein [unclassified Duganella]RFP10603.1 two-component sensor histidine kinase [Duganella sp. BJB475]RFP27368.1 two-component sensor histidine kinase [Duganella sp. BJB476]